ncbi:MAG TPA: adenylate/guanylate cyclase domain-containing protein [Candidatus Limnocylindria bacterium]|nr:adenylate/guanylate cyclase domain-containing protein [Candidatus Limnocylindria bacterium]
MQQLPTGTVTFLFTDIEGSTRLLQATGERWPALLARHAEIMRAAIAAGGGTEIGTEGDSFFAVFPSSTGALEAAIGAQRALGAEPWPADGVVAVRMGLHAGTAQLGTDTYVGLDVHRAARIAAAAHGGQVLVSDTVRSLVEHDLPEGVSLQDLGEHRLKDLAERERLYQVAAPGLERSFPALSTVDGVLNNLPRRLTRFVGREREIEELLEMLAATRLLSLTGPGGTGKTRLSLEVAARSLETFGDGVFFVELSPVGEAEMVAATIAQTLGLPDRGGRSARDRVVDHLGRRHVLLVLDNFEQVIDAAPLVADLLAAAPNLSVITTTRAALHVYGEREYPVPPLALPDLGHLPEAAALGQYEAVALFVERATAVKPDFTVTNENAPAVAEICVRLDGLPLAIELAAARIRILSPQAMLTRIEHRMALLSSGARDLPARQQTLRGAIAWSHDMLDEGDRTLFACLSVFVGSAGLEAIERVCGEAVGGDVLDALSSLVDKSLLRQREGVGGEPRFSMLETIREFAIEQAAARGALEDLRARHAAFFADLARQASGLIMGPERREWLDRLEEEHDNLRAALAWLVATDRAEAALRMSAALWRFWQMRGHLAEGLERVEAALATPHAAEHPAARADALSAGAGLAYWLADTDRSRALYREEIALREELGDRSGLGEAHYGISFTWAIIDLLVEENARQSQEHVSAALAIFTELGDEPGIARCEWALSNLLWGTGQTEGAREHALHALALFESIGDSFMVGWASYTAGLASLSEYTADGATAEARAGARAEARERFTRSLQIFSEAEDLTGYALVLDAFAVIALHDGDRDRAARLSGAVAALERQSGTGLNLWNRSVLGFDPAELAADPEVSDAYRSGAEMSPAEAVAYALGG